MPLTAAEVRATQFTTTRLRAGYSMDEVDAFLDIVEADVAQYADELQRSRDGEAVLRTQCDQLQVRLGIAEGKLADAQATPVAPEPSLTADDAAAVAADPESSTVVAIAQRHADEIVRYAQTRAEAIRSAVRGVLTEQMAQLDRS